MGDRPTSEDVVRKYAAVSAAADLDKIGGLRHPNWSVTWPQSGEQVRSHEAFAEILRHYPGGSPTTELTRVVGTADRWVVTPSNTVVRVAGSGDFWWCEWQMIYPDGNTYLCVDLMELRDGLILNEIVYWAAPFEAPAWRSPWVDRLVDADSDPVRQ
jgi:hypothetical protein